MARKTRVKIFAQNNSEFLKNSLSLLGENFEFSCCEFDSVLQESFDEQDFDIAVLIPDFEKVKKHDDWINSELSFWQTVWKNLDGKKIVQIGYDYNEYGTDGFYLSTLSGQIKQIRTINQTLAEELPKGSYFIDLDAISGFFGKDNFYEKRNYFWFKQPFSNEGMKKLSQTIITACKTLVNGGKKVLVLDLDGTLWDGLCGEKEITFSQNAIDEAYTTFQEYLKGLVKRGVILAVASKNNIEDAKKPFENTVLQLEDFSDFQANWSLKSEMIKEISKNLNLPLESFVFFDDTPAEREEVRQHLPEVSIVEVPNDVSNYIKALENGVFFETLSITDEDKIRTKYKVKPVSTYPNVDEYLKSLEMHANIEPLSEKNLDRIHQLVTKTNQFNMTTKRHSVCEIKELQALALVLRDKFGNLGLTGLILYRENQMKTVEIDTFLLSCRIINRTAEYFLMNKFVETMKNEGITKIWAKYKRTERNEAFKDFYEKCGFKKIGGTDKNKENFELDVANFKELKTFVK